MALCGEREGVVTRVSEAGGALASSSLGGAGVGVALGSASPGALLGALLGALGGLRSSGSGERLQATSNVLHSKSRLHGVGIMPCACSYSTWLGKHRNCGA